MSTSNSDAESLDFASISELSRLLRSREVSSKELTKHFLEQLESIGPKYNALACLLEKRAKKQAGDVDDELKRGRFRGPLQGIPYAVKDLLSVAGYPTTWGAKPFADQVFDRDARVIEKLDRSGAILIGKLAMVELAGGGGYDSAGASLQGPGLNPWNTACWSGGSSSGSGIAVSAGLVPYALGSETSGSIITPSAYCGVTGLRPTYGLVSRRGAMALSWTCDKIGLLARSAEDCGIALQHIAGGDSEDPGSAQKGFYYSPQFQRRFADLKVGYNPIDFEQWPEEAMRPGYAKALNLVKSLGAEMVEMKIPDLPYGMLIGTVIDAEGASIFETLIRSSRVDELADRTQIDGLKASLNYNALDYLKAMRVRSQVQSAFRNIFSNVDVLLAPSLFNLPEHVNQSFEEQEKQRPPKPTEKGVGADLVPASNLAGLPGLSIPCGFANGLPMGLQFVGPPFSENTLLAFGRQFQALTDFHRQRPPIT